MFAGLLTALGLTISGCQQHRDTATAPHAAEPTAIHHVDAQGAAKLINERKVVVLDVRTPQEFAAGHIPGAQLVDFNDPGFQANLSKLDRRPSYLVHCASGRRSTKALETFEALGFREVTHLDGGFNAWKAAGNTVAP